MRVVRIGCVAALALLLAPACTRGQAPGPVASTGTAASRPAPSPSPSASAAALARVPVREVPACDRAACSAVAVTQVRAGVTLALVRGPDRPDGTRQTAYLLSLDPANKRLGVLSLTHGDYFFDSLPELTCDALLHCFVAASSGAHTGVLNVVAVGQHGQLTDISQSGLLSVDTVDVGPADINDDGIDEVLGRVNDFTPNYAGGSDYWMLWVWNGTRYVPLGCRKVQAGEDKPGGPVTPSSCPR